jgi:Mce-associated membrane protein
MTVREMRDRRTGRRTTRLRIVRTPAPDRGDVAEAPDEATRASASQQPAPQETTPQATPAEPGGGRRWRLLTGSLVVLLAAMLTAAAVTGWQWYERRALESAHQAALAAARQITVDFVSISASTVDRDLQRIANGATGEFKEEFTRGMPQVRQAVVENNVESQGTVLRAGLVSGDRDSAVVLVAVDTTVKNARAPEGRVSHYRIQVDMVVDRESGRWLVSRLQFVG